MKHLLKEGKISKLEGGDTSEVFLLEHTGRKYVLRNFESKKKADYYISLAKKLKKYGFLPKIYYQDGKKVLFEYIEGRDCNKKETPAIIRQVGKICGQINNIGSKEKYNPDKRFDSYMVTLKKKHLISKDQIKLIEELYSRGKRARPKIVMDANDVYPNNFRLRNGKVYLVDIEAIKPLFRGYGIAKAFIRWFKKPKQRQYFKEEYKSAHSTKFLTDDYLQFLYLNFFMRSIAIKLRLDKELNPEDVKRLHLLLKGKLK